MKWSVVIVKQHFLIGIGVIMLHVSFVVFWNYLCLPGSVVLVQLKERSSVVKVILIVFILGFIYKFLINKDIKCGPLDIFLQAVEVCFGERFGRGLENYMPI